VKGVSTVTERAEKAGLLRMKDVYKQYGKKVILDDIDLTVRRGELCTLVGPSGCGKSTLLRLILGQERVTDGEILIDGVPVGFPDTDRGIVYQKYSLYPHLTTLQNVTLGLRLSAGFMERRRKGKQFRDEARYHLERSGLEGHGSKYPHELSGGMQQRVAIAQARHAPQDPPHGRAFRRPRSRHQGGHADLHPRAVE
jgi:NitT/TauT family transport system ATP-binding protein